MSKKKRKVRIGRVLCRPDTKEYLVSYEERHDMGFTQWSDCLENALIFDNVPEAVSMGWHIVDNCNISIEMYELLENNKLKFEGIAEPLSKRH